MGRAVSYDNSLGIRTRIDCCTDTTINEDEVIYIQEYADYDAGDKFYHPLVSKSASGDKLYVTYDSVHDEYTVTVVNPKMMQIEVKKIVELHEYISM